MNAAEHILPPASTSARSGTRHARPVSRLRGQAAFVRTLLDELERIAPADSDELLADQVVEELARLGWRCAELARALGAVVGEQERVSHERPPCA